MSIVGLPGGIVQGSRERVYSTIKIAGLFYPRKPLMVNLAPATVRKKGPSYDLPIALGVLVDKDQLEVPTLEKCLEYRRTFAGCGYRYVDNCFWVD